MDAFLRGCLGLLSLTARGDCSVVLIARSKKDLRPPVVSGYVFGTKQGGSVVSSHSPLAQPPPSAALCPGSVLARFRSGEAPLLGKEPR